MKPMLAAKLDWDKVQYPVFVSPKLDGIRCIMASVPYHSIRQVCPMSRTWKVLPNSHLRALVKASQGQLLGLDGELCVGPVAAPNVFQASMSGIMSYDGKPDITYLVFDYLGDVERDDDVTMREPYFNRLSVLNTRSLPDWVKVVPQMLCRDRENVERIEAKCLELGYEGAIVRGRNSPYKMGRSTVREGYLLKLKRFETAEAEVIGYEELQHNLNTATIDEQGHTHRTSHQAGQVPGNMLGALTVRLLPPNEGVTFSIGSGFDHAQRQALWSAREYLKGRVVTFKSQPHGSKDAPRFPIFLGFRDPIDIGGEDG